MADDLPAEYDDIILGTGLQESILAAALARIGRRVLHFDRNNFYSGEWASFHLQGILEWVEKYQTSASEPCSKDAFAATASSSTSPSAENSSPPSIEDGLKLVPVPNEPSAVFNLTTTRYVRDVVQDEEEAKDAGDGSPPSAEESRSEDDGSPSVEVSRPEDDQTDDQNSSSPNGQELGASSGAENEKANGQSLGESSDPADQSQVVNSAEEDQNSNTLDNDDDDDDVGGVTGDPTDLPPEVSSADGDQNRNAVDDDGGGATAEATRRKTWTWQEIYEQWRRFNIDLAPKLMFCRGAMVDILVQSRISRYAEFKAVSRLLTSIENKLEHVPCSRSDVFSSRYVSMLEKRMLMKLIEFVLHYQDRTDDYEGFKDKPFSEFLQKRKLTPTLQHFVIHSIAMVTASTPTEEALQAMQFFLKSLGRYGNTAFLWTLYGSGELPQCFCRMAAVFGGIYMLRTTADFLIVDTNKAFASRLTLPKLSPSPSQLSCNDPLKSYTIIQVLRACGATSVLVIEGHIGTWSLPHLPKRLIGMLPVFHLSWCSTEEVKEVKLYFDDAMKTVAQCQ